MISAVTPRIAMLAKLELLDLDANRMCCQQNHAMRPSRNAVWIVDAAHARARAHLCVCARACVCRHTHALHCIAYVWCPQLTLRLVQQHCCSATAAVGRCPQCVRTLRAPLLLLLCAVDCTVSGSPRYSTSCWRSRTCADSIRSVVLPLQRIRSALLCVGPTVAHTACHSTPRPRPLTRSLLRFDQVRLAHNALTECPATLSVG